MKICKAEPTCELIRQLISLSQAWSKEGSCRGYCPNTESDIRDRQIFCAFQGETVIGYLFGIIEEAKHASSVMADGTPCFELEEIYISPQYRSQGIGRQLFSCMETWLASTGAEYILLSTATKNHRAILHFYIDEMGMDFWSARLFKKIRKE